MKAAYDESGVTLYEGDCRQVLAALPACSVDTVITDPPYGLAFMGKEWDHLVPGAEYWAEALRVAKPGAMLLAFGGTRTYHRLACAIEDAGWEIRDCLMWLYGSGFPKSLDISKAIDKAARAEREIIGHYDRGGDCYGVSKTRVEQGYRETVTKSDGAITAPSTDAAKTWQGYGTALKPAWEPIILAMKPLDGTFADNALKHGVAGLHIDGGRIDSVGPHGTAGRKTFHGFAEDTAFLGKLNTQKSPPNAIGRWPANLLLDEEAAALLDQQSGELKSGRLGAGHRQGGSAIFDNNNGSNRIGKEYGNDSGGASRFFYVAKASKSDRGEGNDHPTVKPLDLLKYLCLLTATPTGGVVLDPFMGSGTTIAAAKETGRQAIGIDRESKYINIAVKRLAQEVLPL